MEKQKIETLNLIPADYDGDPREALGYTWANFADRIPGEDVSLDRNWKEYLLGRYGEGVEIHKDNSYGRLKNTSGQIIAMFNCMWCGGMSGIVYRPDTDTTPPESFDRNQTGDSFAETAARLSAAEKIELTEMDERQKNHPGYCTKCHSYCYGDCDA